MKHSSQRGSVIIVTLWTITLLTILITALAGQTRLSAHVALSHKEELEHWADVLAAVNQAEMELVLENMPQSPEIQQDLSEVGRNARFRYNGQELQLSYPQAEDVGVRIYNHAGKINLREISSPNLRALLQKKLGADADPQQLEELIAAWNDWHDLNDLTSINGAENSYYEELEPPYLPRNGRLETVEEILLIRGFAELFADVDLDAAFTLYGDDRGGINLNLATIEAMRLLPGLDEELIAEILAYRQENEFQGNGDVAQIVPAESMAELRVWLDNRTSNVYSIMVYRKVAPDAEVPEDEDAPPPETVAATAFAETVQVNSDSDTRPRVLKINPYQTIPISVLAVTESEQ